MAKEKALSTREKTVSTRPEQKPKISFQPKTATQWLSILELASLKKYDTGVKVSDEEIQRQMARGAKSIGTELIHLYNGIVVRGQLFLDLAMKLEIPKMQCIMLNDKWTPLEVEAYALDVFAGQILLTEIERHKIYKRLLVIEKELARERKKRKAKTVSPEKEQSNKEKDQKAEKGRARVVAAKKAGMKVYQSDQFDEIEKKRPDLYSLCEKGLMERVEAWWEYKFPDVDRKKGEKPTKSLEQRFIQASKQAANLYSIMGDIKKAELTAIMNGDNGKEKYAVDEFRSLSKALAKRLADRASSIANLITNLKHGEKA